MPPPCSSRLSSLGALTVDRRREPSLQLLLENEKGVVGDIPERCLQIMGAIDSPHFKLHLGSRPTSCNAALRDQVETVVGRAASRTSATYTSRTPSRGGRRGAIDGDGRR